MVAGSGGGNADALGGRLYRIGHIHRQTAWSMPPDSIYSGFAWKA